jgi:hypothetical protein
MDLVYLGLVAIGFALTLGLVRLVGSLGRSHS